MMREQFLRDAPAGSRVYISHSHKYRGRVSQPGPHQCDNDVRLILR